jgi:endonuclease V-like protein UPF0215 family
LSGKRFRVVKPEIRVLGVDDGVFTPHVKGSALIVGVVFRGGLWLDGVMHTKVRVDGLDATRKIASMIIGSPHHKQLRVIMLDGVTFAGFNVVDIKKLSAETGLPAIAVTRDKPNFAEIRQALENLPHSEKRWSAIRGPGELFEVCTRSENVKVYMQTAGVCEEDARRILQVTSTRSSIPEALRVAHLIASGISAETKR